MASRFKFLFLLFTVLTCFSSMMAQDASTPEKSKKPAPKENKSALLEAGKNPTAEQIAETTIYTFSGRTNRAVLNQIRRTTIENGKLSITGADGKSEQVNYERRIVRGDSLEKERIRLDQEFPNAKYALIYNDNKVVGLYNDSVFTPREDAAKAFQNQIWHGLEALLRYKENGSTLKLVGREKMMGVDFYILDVTDKENRQTRFYISAKTFSIKSLEYTADGVKYTRRFYDYRYAQGTLVPYRTVLLADGKQIEESNVMTSTFGQKLDEDIFKSN